MADNTDNAEIWKDVEGWPYEVSDMGRVRNKRTGRCINGTLNIKHGYRQTMLYRLNEDGEREYRLFNTKKLVAVAFLPPPKHGEDIVTFKSRDKSDNRASNLMWAFRDGTRNSEYGHKCPMYEARCVKPVVRHIVRQYTDMGLCIGMYEGFDELEKKGYKKLSIMQAANGSYKASKGDVYKGYKWSVEKIKGNKKN